jgi:spore coat protein A
VPGSCSTPPGDNEEFEAEFFGDVPVVNGKTYPYLEVEPRSYRFRTLNGSNGRAFNMTLEDADDQNADVPLVRQIATDLGFLDAPVSIGPGGDLSSLTLNGAERADVVVDFAGFEGRTFHVTNDAETPYAGENTGTDMPELLQIRVGETVTEPDETIPLTRFLRQIRKRYPRTDLPVETTRYMTLDTGTIPVDNVDLDSHFLNNALWTDAEAVETVSLDTSEDWVLANTTGDVHPIHLHLVDFDVVKRQDFDVDGFFESLGGAEGGGAREQAVKDNLGDPRPDLPNEAGPKDTVSVFPDEAVTIRPSFTDFTGYYVWHCHILEHEDQEMMLPYVVQ